MLDDKDIQKLIAVFPTRAEVASKEDFLTLQHDFNEMLTAVDAYAQKADAYMRETVMLSRQMNRPEKWIEQLAENAGLPLKS